MGYIAMPHIEASLAAGGNRTLEAVGLQPTFSLDSPEAREWLSGKGTDYWASANAPNATTIDAIHSALVEGLEEGATPAALREAVQAVFTEASRTRATRIARTETVGAYNGGGHVVREELAAQGVKTAKEWITTLDDRTRESHWDADGQTQKQGRPFDIGGSSLQYPGDPNGSPEEIINCRCACGTKIVE